MSHVRVAPPEPALVDATQLADLYRLAVANLPASVVLVFDHDLRFVLADGPELARHGTTKAALEGRRLGAAVDPQFAAVVEPNIRAALAGRRFRAEIPYGDLVYAYTYEPLRGADGDVAYALVLGQDITQLSHAERRVGEHETRTREFVGSLPAMVFAVGADRRLRLFGGAAAERLGTPSADVVGASIDELYAGEPDLIALLTRALAGERLRSDVGCHGRLWDLHLSPVRGQAGDVTEVVGVAVDITEQRHRESADRQRQKLEALGRLAGGVAHDFNNMLMVIRGHAELALADLVEGHPLRDYLAEIRQAADHSARLVQQMLAFARQQPTLLQVIDVNSAVGATLNMLGRVIGENVELVWAPGVDVGHIRVDPVQLDQVVTNLCLNARDAITGVGRITVSTRLHEHPGGASGEASVPPGRFAVLSVADDGGGMSPETLERVFEPFFTTKKLGRGNGLGLATVFGFAKQHGGFVTAASEPHLGSLFEVYLPSHLGAVPRVGTTVAQPAPATRGGTVLIVEDEPAVLSATRTMLESLGYTVLTAETPVEALALAEREAGAIDVLLSDVVMPGMNGRDLADRFLALRPGVRVLFMSGYARNVVIRRGSRDQGVRLLRKPFTRDELAASVRALLDADD